MKYIKAVRDPAKKFKQLDVEDKMDQPAIPGNRFIDQQAKYHCESSIPHQCQVRETELANTVDKKESKVQCRKE